MEKGCEIGQGYLFSKPMPALEAEAMLLGSSPDGNPLATSESCGQHGVHSRPFCDQALALPIGPVGFVLPLPQVLRLTRIEEDAVPMTKGSAQVRDFILVKGSGIHGAGVFAKLRGLHLR